MNIVPQKHLPEVFNTHHCSSSNHRRNSLTNSTTMTSGHRLVTDELSKKAEQILGLAPTVVDYQRQQSMDFAVQHAPRWNMTSSTAPTNHHEMSPVTKKSIKRKHAEVVEQLVPLIFKVVSLPSYKKLPEKLSKHSKVSTRKIENRQFNNDIDLKLSDDENEDGKISNENQNKNQHADSDNQVSNHSDMENDDESNQTNPKHFSLMDFIPSEELAAEKSADNKKRSLSPALNVDNIKPIKRREDLIKSFASDVNIPIDTKQPALHITIPTHLFNDEPKIAEDEQIIEKSQKSSKRSANGSMKQETHTNESSHTTNAAQQKKNKTSHVYKLEPSISFPTTRIKDESTSPRNSVSCNEASSCDNSATVTSTTAQPKKKPTANVKPLLQTSTVNSLSSTTNNSNVLTTSDRLTTVASVSTRLCYANLNMSTKELNNLARERKKQADGEKRTFEDVKQSMSLYLESVCYFIKCAHDESILEQRTTLLSATLSMLQHLVRNFEKMFHISTTQSMDPMPKLRQQFLLINYWLQSYIYQLQYNISLPSVERCVTHVADYYRHSTSPAENNQNFINEFAKHMLNAYYSNHYWNKAERSKREEPLKKFNEQLLRQNQNRRLARDDSTLDFLLYIFDAIDLLRVTVI